MKLIMYRGDTKTVNFACKQADGSELPLTDLELTFTVRPSPAEEILFTKTIGSGITVTDELAGLATVVILPEDTEGLYAPSVLAWDFEVVTLAEDTFTLAAGPLQVKPDVTQ